jgi:hypothetical protein
MSYHVRRIRRENPKPKPRSIKTLQKPNGVISLTPSRFQYQMV